MPLMNFDLEDGKPEVSFTLKPADTLRFVAFMAECHAANKDAARYRYLRARLGFCGLPRAVQDVIDDRDGDDLLDDAIDTAMQAGR